MTLIEEAVTNRLFHQIPFMSERQFNTFLRDRDLNVGVEGVRAFVDAGLIEKLDTELGDFHPFQIWPIRMSCRGLETRIDSGINFCGLEPARLKEFIDQNWSYCAQHLTDWPKSGACREFNQQFLPLLLWLEPYFLPTVRGPRPGVVNYASDDPDSWMRWKEETKIQDWLDKHSISVERLTEWRSDLLFGTSTIDPTPDLYLLLRSMPFAQRSKFKGRLRLAHDLYELAEITRMCLEQVSDNPVTKEWDPTGHPDTIWVERNFGSQPKFGSPGFLRPVVRHYGLDPAFRVLWLVEGATEEGFILEYAKAIGSSALEFVTIRNFGGEGALGKQRPDLDAALNTAREEQCFVTLTFDSDSPQVRTRAEKLEQDGLVNLPCVLNDPDFELKNFKVEQLVAVAVAWASDLSQPVTLDQDTLVQEIKERISDKQVGFQKAFNDVLHKHAEQFKLSKGAKWGERLADHLIGERDREIKEDVYHEGNLSKIEQQIFFVVRGSQPFIDYPGSIQRLNRDS